MKSVRKSGRLWLGAMIAASMVSIGCQQSEPAPSQPVAAGAPAMAAKGCNPYRPNAAAGMVVNALAFPTGDVNSSAILLHTVTPAEARVGQPYSYELHVTNLSTATLQNVNVLASNAANLDVTTSSPEAAKTGGGFNWNLGNIPGCETRVIKVTGRADAVGVSSNCLSVTYNNLLCTTVKITQPALALTKTAPAEVLLCDPIQMILEVKNTGSGTASGVKVMDVLPPGLKTTDGQQNVTADVGDLGPGQSKRVTINVKAERTGSFQNQATSAAAGNLTAQSNTTTTVVRQPKLEIVCTAPERIFIGRDATFSFTVKNSGDAASRDTVLNLPAPAGSSIVSATEGGTVGAGGVAWNLGSLAAGASRTVSVVLKPVGQETLRASATAQGYCATPVTANCVTSVEGIPAVLLEVIDLIDPVEVGGQTTYVITATNQGSVPLENLQIVGMLGAGQDYVSSSGATTATATGKTVTFAPIPALAVGGKAEWRVVIRATAEGDNRFETSLSTQRFAKPIVETESTNQYK